MFLEKLFQLFSPKSHLIDVGYVVSILVELFEHFEKLRTEEGESARQAAIDAAIEILQEEKNK